MKRSGRAKWLLRAVASVAAAGLTVGTAAADTLLLSDNFDSVNDNASTFNDTLGADQAGTQATVGYTLSGWWINWQSQHGNGGEMILAGWNAGAGANLYASLDRNFAADANAANRPMKIQAVVKVSDASDASNWAAIAIGSAQNAFVNDAANKFSSLFRRNGGTQQFASNSLVGDTATCNPAGSLVTLILSDAAGTGSAFNGFGSVVKFYIDGVLAATHVLAQMSADDGYISFEAHYAFGRYDNLSISLLDPAAVTWDAPVAIAGDSDVSTTGSLAYAYNQCNADQTVNGVPFSAGHSTSMLGGCNVTMLGFDGATTSAGGPGAGGSISAAYNSVLDGFIWKNAGSPASFTLHNLVPGRAYQVQFWVADYRTPSWANADRSETLSAVNTSGLLRYMDADNTYGIHGSTVTGTFTANGGCQTIDIVASESAQMNAVQLRQMVPSVSGAGYFDASEAAVWDAFTTLSWAAASGGPYDKLWGRWGVAHFEGAGGGVAIRQVVEADGVVFHADGCTLSGGTLRTGSPAGGPHFTVSGSSATIASATANTGGGAVKDGAGTLVLSNVGNQSFSSITIQSGALELAVAADTDSGAATTFYGAGTLRKSGAGRLAWGAAATKFALLPGALIDVQCGSLIGGSWQNENWDDNHSDLHVAGGATFATVEANVRLNRITGSGTIGTGYAGAGYESLTIGVDGDSSTFDGVIENTDGNPAFAGNLVKAGAGTITLAGANTYTGSTTINDGALRLGTNNALNAGHKIVLAGGALDMGAFSNAVGTLDVTAASRLTLGPGSISFADSSALVWEGSLTLEGHLGPQAVRFGNSSDALTAEQLRKIKIGGKSVALTPSGYLVIRGLLVMVL